MDLHGRDTLLLSGGGFKAVAYCGVLSYLPPFTHFVGVSAGALLALFLALDFTPKAIAEAVEASGLGNIFRAHWAPTQLLGHGGTMPRHTVLDIVRGLLPPGLTLHSTLAEVATAHPGKTLAMITAALEPPALYVLSSASTPHCSLRRALAAAMALPGLFAPVRIGGVLCVDAGLVNNSPISLLPSPRRAVVLTAMRTAASARLPWYLRAAVQRATLLTLADLRAFQREALVIYVRPPSSVLRSTSAAEAQAAGALAWHARCQAQALAGLLVALHAQKRAGMGQGANGGGAQPQLGGPAPDCPGASLDLGPSSALAFPAVPGVGLLGASVEPPVSASGTPESSGVNDPD